MHSKKISKRKELEGNRQCLDSTKKHQSQFLETFYEYSDSTAYSLIMITLQHTMYFMSLYCHFNHEIEMNFKWNFLLINGLQIKNNATVNCWEVFYGNFFHALDFTVPVNYYFFTFALAPIYFIVVWMVNLTCNVCCVL